MTQVQATENKKDVAANVDVNNGELVLTFANGKTIKVIAKALETGIQAHAIMHGLKQKLVDAAAISRNPDTGATASIEDKYQAVYGVYQRLLNGEWNKTREGGGVAGGGLLFRALCKLRPTTPPETLREFLAGKTKAEQAALRANPKIAAIIDAIRAESATGIDTDTMLNELEN